MRRLVLIAALVSLTGAPARADVIVPPPPPPPPPASGLAVGPVAAGALLATGLVFAGLWATRTRAARREA